jgi:hypothetical protein
MLSKIKMASPSKASHGCFGTDNRFSIGQFVGDASELSNVAEWKTVTKRNQNGKLSKLEAEEISNLQNWNMIPKRGKQISLAVAPKVNDRHDQNVHSKIMKKTRNVRNIMMNQPKKKKSFITNDDFEDIVKETEFQNSTKDINDTEKYLIKDWKTCRVENIKPKPRQLKMKKDYDTAEFGAFLKEIDENETLLTKESNLIEVSLKQAAKSTK